MTTPYSSAGGFQSLGSFTPIRSAFSSAITSIALAWLRFSFSAISFIKSLDRADNANDVGFFAAIKYLLIGTLNFSVLSVSLVYDIKLVYFGCIKVYDLLEYFVNSTTKTMGYREPRIVGQGICPYCGDEFDKHDKRQKYCNPTCRGLYAEEHSPKKASYFKILARDGFKCLYCGRTPVEDGVKLCLDHLFPYVNGGRTDLNNLVTCCEECNQRKSELVMSKEVMDRFYGVINKRNEVFTMADYERISGHMLDYFQRSR